MSCSYADGLSQYENKGVLGLEEVKSIIPDRSFGGSQPSATIFNRSSPDVWNFFFLQRYDSIEALRLKCGLLADWIQAARHVVVHTGAGISTAAGIPDFRWLSFVIFRSNPHPTSIYFHPLPDHPDPAIAIC